MACAGGPPGGATGWCWRGGRAAFLLVFTPLAFGTVEPWSEAIAELVVLGMVVAWLLEHGAEGLGAPHLRLPPGWLAASLFLALIFLQAVPIPMALARAISPWTTGFRDQVRMYTGGPGPSSVRCPAAHDTWREALKVGAVAAFFLVCYNVYRTTRAGSSRPLDDDRRHGAAICGARHRPARHPGTAASTGSARRPPPERRFRALRENRAHFAGLMVDRRADGAGALARLAIHADAQAAPSAL